MPEKKIKYSQFQIIQTFQKNSENGKSMSEILFYLFDCAINKFKFENSVRNKK